MEFKVKEGLDMPFKFRLLSKDFFMFVLVLQYITSHLLTKQRATGDWLVGCIEDLRRFSGISAISPVGSRVANL